uniref:Uncharacterized protein n=1 Tax=Oryza meridionalis TaxID=40149 RepID=A0A0E0CBX9_9ORYZ
MATKLTEAETAPAALFPAAVGASAGVSSLLDGAIPAPASAGLGAAADESMGDEARDIGGAGGEAIVIALQLAAAAPTPRPHCAASSGDALQGPRHQDHRHTPVAHLRRHPGLDTRAQAVSAGPAWPPGEGDSTLPSCSTVFVPVGDKLYALDGGGDSGRAVSFQVLFPSGGAGWWSWSSVASAAPPPFDPSRITSYAAHPNGRAFFVSMARKDVPFFPALSRGWLWLHAGSTFCFDTESLEWTDYGCWMLPFQGQGHYDAELDAWVGICRHPDKPGRLCSSDVPAPRIRGRDSRWRVPSCKIGKDVLFCKDKERHRGVALQYMGSDSNFCLLECVEQPAATASRLMYVRMFRLKYGKDGGLRTATRGRWGRCFLLPPEASSFDVMDQKITAFLMGKT